MDSMDVLMTACVASGLYNVVGNGKRSSNIAGYGYGHVYMYKQAHLPAIITDEI